MKCKHCEQRVGWVEWMVFGFKCSGCYDHFKYERWDKKFKESEDRLEISNNYWRNKNDR